MTRSAKHPSLKHLVASTIGFTAGYLIGVLIEGTSAGTRTPPAPQGT